MALSKGTNSYATVREADAYFADRLGAAAWGEASDEQKAQALVTASSILDGMSWSGEAVSQDQKMAFPRNGWFFDPFVGAEVEMGAGVPGRVVKAAFELASHYLSEDSALESSGEVRNLSVGSIRLEFIQKASRIPSDVKNLIRPLLVNSGARVWWRAN